MTQQAPGTFLIEPWWRNSTGRLTVDPVRGIHVDQLKIEYIPISQLMCQSTAWYEPDWRQIRCLAVAILSVGWTAPIVVNTHNEVIAGRARVDAAIALGLADVPAVRIKTPDYLAAAYMRVCDKLLAQSESGWKCDAYEEAQRHWQQAFVQFDMMNQGQPQGDVGVLVHVLDAPHWVGLKQRTSTGALEIPADAVRPSRTD